MKAPRQRPGGTYDTRERLVTMSEVLQHPLARQTPNDKQKVKNGKRQRVRDRERDRVRERDGKSE